MARREGYRHHRGAWQPNTRQRAVLDLLAEGKSNAELAERLGITLDGAKWHVSELLAETGCEDRQALASWWEEERRRRHKGVLVWSAALRYGWAALAISLAVGVVLLAGLLPGSSDGNSSPPGPQAAADFAPSPSPTATPQSAGVASPPPCDVALPGGFRGVQADELRAEGLVEFGRIVEPRSCPMQVANRPDTVFFWLADGGEVDLPEAGLHAISSFGPYYRGSSYLPSDLGFYFEGEQFRVNMWIQDEGRPVFTEGSAPNTRMSLDGNSRIVVTRIGPSGAFASVTLEGEESGRHRLAIASDGTLFFDPGPLPGDLVTNWTTGEAIDVSGMVALGQAEFTPSGYPDTPGTGCHDETHICEVGLPAVTGPIKLPVGGVLTCIPVRSAGVERESYEIDTGDYILRLSPSGGYGVPWDGGCSTVSAWRDDQTHAVSPGDDLHVWTYTSLSAFAPDGSPKSLVITRDGHLYLGEVTLELECPCVPGN